MEYQPAEALSPVCYPAPTASCVLGIAKGPAINRGLFHFTAVRIDRQRPDVRAGNKANAGAAYLRALARTANRGPA
jgi:hypothetical protein